MVYNIYVSIKTSQCKAVTLHSNGELYMHIPYLCGRHRFGCLYFYYIISKIKISMMPAKVRNNLKNYLKEH